MKRITVQQTRPGRYAVFSAREGRVIAFADSVPSLRIKVSTYRRENALCARIINEAMRGQS